MTHADLFAEASQMPSSGHNTQCAVQGESVPLPQIMDLRKILTESTTDLRQPIGLERQLLESCHATDGEVGLSMLQLLKVSPTRLMLSIHVHCHCKEQYMRTL